MRTRPKPVPVVLATLMRPGTGCGVQTHTRMLEEGLARAGFLCALVTPFSGSPRWYPVFAVRRLLLRRLNRNWSTRWYRHWHFAALRENLLRHLAANPAAVVVAQCPLSARAALQVRARLRAPFRVALVCQFNVSQADEFRGQGELDDEATARRIVDLESHVLQEVDRVVYVSHWARQATEERHGVGPRSSVVIGYGLPEAVPPSCVTRADLGLNPGDLVLVNVGSLEPRKDQLGLLDLFAEVAARHPRARLVLVGDGPQRGAVKWKVEQKGLAGKVVRLGARSDVPALLPLADLYVHYAAVESFGIVLLEAARAGLPCAAVPAGGIAELQDPLGVVPLQREDVPSSLRALESLLEDDRLRADLGRRARDNFRRSFTREVMVRAYVEALGLAEPVAADFHSAVGTTRGAGTAD